VILIKQSLKGLKSEFPPIQELVPHARTMCLLDRLVAWDGSKARCVLTVSEKDPFADYFGRIPAYVGIEYISQCAAAHASLKKKGEKEDSSPKVALLISTRKVEFFVDHFTMGQILEIQTVNVSENKHMAAFSGEISDAESGEVFLKATLNFYQPKIV